jgi:ArsR family transcriptional regulator, zinc-responsive transcriptional repressor
MDHESASVAVADPVDDVVVMLRTLSDPTRLRLLSVLQRGEQSVTALCSELNLAQPTVSHHLGRLRSVRLVANRRAGKQVFYSINGQLVSKLCEQPGLLIASGMLELKIQRPVDDGAAVAYGEF